MSFVDNFNYFFNLFTNKSKEREETKQKILEDSKKLTSDNYWKQQSVRKDEPVIPETVADEETFLLDHRWEHVLTEEDGCDTWSYPQELRKYWPKDILYQYGTQHWWDRDEAMKLQNEINARTTVQLAERWTRITNDDESSPPIRPIRPLKLDYQSPIPVVKLKMQEGTKAKGRLYPWEPCNCVETIDDDKIRELAYYKWEAAGRPEGDGSYFWGLAEQELRSHS